MATNYPSSLDTFDTIASDKKTSDTVGGRTHRQMHNDLGDAIEAVQTELGTDPAGIYSTVKARLDALVAYAVKTSAYTATVADHTLNVTSGTFTLDLPAASTCTGQSLRVKNSGTGVVTLDGNSSETVEGVATFPLGPGSYVEITSTGSAWILTCGVADTGVRNINGGTWLNGWAAHGSTGQMIRRVGDLVEMQLDLNKASASADACYTIPSGFRPALPSVPVFVAPTATTAEPAQVLILAGEVSVARASLAGDVTYLRVMFTTRDAWPTSLPGSAA